MHQSKGQNSFSLLGVVSENCGDSVGFQGSAASFSAMRCVSGHVQIFWLKVKLAYSHVV